MAVIYMVHETHGAKVAISEAEANYDELHGWTRYTPDTPSPGAGEDSDEPVASALAAPRRRARSQPQQEP